MDVTGGGQRERKIADCPLKYIRQRGRTFNIRYKEHIQAIRNNNSNSGYSNHILNTGHTYGTITDIMEIIKTGKKGRHLNTLEKYHVYRISKDNLHMNDTYTYTTPYLKHRVNSTPDSSKFTTTPPTLPLPAILRLP
jgi:hypothetical protein